MTSFEKADIIVMPGGGDLNPALYGHEPIKRAYFNIENDKRQMELVNETIKAGKFLYGTCRGMQLLTARAGGWLIQDSNHRGSHNITTKDGQIFKINSCHHQMCYPYDMPEENYELLGWARQLSDYHIIQGDKQLEFKKITLDEDGLFKEPEIIYYPKIRAICSQNHFEWGTNSREAEDYINKIIREKLEI
ncbi:MAG: gamma-glutamyl-gamma-aminobutyrate hydrolase family protein [Candidatus Paceibacteria bacterium]